MTGPAVRTVDATAIDHKLSARRLNVMRCGYAFMGVGLAIVKWPVSSRTSHPFRCSKESSGRRTPLVADDLNAATREVLFSCSLVVIIVAVIPWRYVGRRYVRAHGDAWR